MKRTNRQRSAGGPLAWPRALVLVAAAAVTGCGNLTAGGVAEAEAVVTGNESSESPSASAAGSGAAVPAEQLVGGPIQGTVTARLTIYLVGPGLVDISGGERSVTVDIRGEAPISLGSTPIPVGAYESVRVVFSEVKATVTAGLGGGPLLDAGTVTVDFGGEPTITVERSLPTLAEEDDRLVATVDLRAPAWLQSVALQTPRTVPAALFRTMVRLSLDRDR